MAALNDDALLIESGNLWVGDDAGSLVDMGALRNIRFTSEQVSNVINSDNRGEILRKVSMPGRIEAELLEPGDVDTLENIFKGIVTKGSVAATPVAGDTQALASPFVPNTFYEFENQQADGTVPTTISLAGATDGALTLDDDYHIIQNPNTGKWGVILNTVAGGGALSTLSQVVTITYSYTPAAAKTVVCGTSQTATPRYVKIIAPSEDDSNKTREITFESALASSPMLLPFTEVESAGDVGVMPVIFETRKGSEWTYRDEIAI
jgi:hypothetical protein